MIERTTNTCPYCQKPLAKVPTRKTFCPDCGKLIRVLQGYLYTEVNYEEASDRMANAPSWEQLAFMVNLGIAIPRSCTSEQASRLIERAKPADEPTPSQREAYIQIKNAIATRVRDGESIDDIIENPPSQPLISNTQGAGCAGVLVLIIAALFYSFVRIGWLASV